MNSSGCQDDLNNALTTFFITFVLVVIINSINGSFVYTYFKSQIFQRDPRYLLYIHLVINDMLLLTLSVMLQILTYTIPLSLTSCCIFLLILVTTNKNSPLNLAGMALERYVAVCHPLHHAEICMMQRAYAMIAVIWLASCFPALVDILIVLATQPPSVFSSTVICYSAYIYNTPYHKAQSVVVQVLLFSFVFFTVFITYLKVFLAQSASGTNRVSARNARNTIMLHGVQLLICMLSYITPFINFILVYAWPSDRTKILLATFLLTNVLPRLLSPLIYGVRDEKFNRHLRMNFFCKCFNSVNKRVKLILGAQRKPKQASL